MRTVAVVAHREKTLGGGLNALRKSLEARGVEAPLWYEVPKSKRAPKRVRQALEDGADLVFVWGGDGMVQRCADVMAGSGVPLAVIPAGTANLLARNLGIPADIDRAVEIGLDGRRRLLDLGIVNGEKFAVMAGAGFDAAMIRDVDGAAKSRLGRLAYVWSGARNLRRNAVDARVRVDGTTVYEGRISCVLAGNVGSLFGGVTVFPEAEPDDGRLELAVVTAGSVLEWMRVMATTARGRADASPFVRTYRARSIRVRFDDDVPYELDGGDRGETDRWRVDIAPRSLVICVDGDTDAPGNQGNGASGGHHGDGGPGERQ